MARRGFGTVTAVLGLALAAASAPSPLYASYAAMWHFGPTTLTAVFAVYAVALLAALLVVGSLSDAVGRRPVILAGLMLLAVGMLLFLVADGIVLLFCARVVQGFATALLTAGVAAALLDLQPANRPGRAAVINAVTPAAGLAVGALVAGFLVQYCAAPTRLVYAVLLGGCIVLAALVTAIPEPATSRRPIDLRIRVAVDPAVRPSFLAVAPCMIATWALGGLYLSLGPSLGENIAGTTNRLVGGSLVFALCGPAAAASLLAGNWAPARTVRVGCGALIVGLAATVEAVATGSTAVLVAATVVAGAGFGLGFLGSLRELVSRAAPARRGELVSAVYVVAYLAFSLPAVLAGALTTHLGLRPTAAGYAVGVGLLSLAALLASLRRRSAQLPAAAAGAPPETTSTPAAAVDCSVPAET